MSSKKNKTFVNSRLWLLIAILFFVIILFFLLNEKSDGQYELNNFGTSTDTSIASSTLPLYPPLDTLDYDNRLFKLANMTEYIKPISTSTKLATTSISTATTSTSTPLKYYQTSYGKMRMKVPLWPVKKVYPLDGAILPFKRIIAYYGNFYSKGMGVLGQYPEETVLEKLQNELDKWNLADPETPALPAIHYIAVTAQGSAGDGKYRLRMPFNQIDKAIEMAKKIHGIVFLDIQVALSNLETELPLLERYLRMPEVHVGIDPEFSMKTGKKPGTVIGTMDATDINYAIDYLTKLVDENNLPPKILVVHRFTQAMLTHYKQIKTVPEVQIVINMDGWGIPKKKLGTYQQVIYPEPVQFTGFKLFYRNDTKTGTPLMTPAELLKITPAPIYIQYQ